MSAADDNPYNLKTREILESFFDMDILPNEGNVVFPEGNALRYLGEYFTEEIPSNPYVEDSKDIRCISFGPDGSVLDGNAFTGDILTILRSYSPV